MEGELQSILLEDFEIAWPGFVLRRLALNQHMPRVEKLSEHVHGFHQLLLYLRGRGNQWIGGESVAVERGVVLFIEGGEVHRFVKGSGRRPVCLAIDFEAEAPADWRRESRVLPDGLAGIERRLVLLHEEESTGRRATIRGASLILEVLALIEESVRAEPGERTGPVGAAIERIVEEGGFPGLTPGAIARRAGRTLDTLNRALRRESGITVGAMLSRCRRKEAERLLATSSLEVGEIASSVGIDDQNYFSRWFRKQTGQTPTRWREAMVGPDRGGAPGARSREK